MAVSKTWSGARALCYVNLARNPNVPGTNSVAPPNQDGLTLVGYFTDVSWSYSYMEQDINILGRFSPVSIEYTGANTVTGNCSGWRVIDNGPMISGLFPTLDQLLNYPDLRFKIVDRQDPNKVLCDITNVKPISYDSGIANKSTSTFRMSWKGTNLGEDGLSNIETGVPGLLG